MTDLDDRLRTGMTALAERSRPAAEPAAVAAQLSARSRHNRKGWMFAAAAAAVVVVLVGAATVVATRPDNATVVDSGPDTSVSTSVTTTPTTMRVVPTGDWDPTTLGRGWHELGPGLAEGTPSLFAWTGSEFVLFGTSDVEERFVNQGVAFDPTTGTSVAIGPGPLTDRFAMGGAWIGTELLVWSRSGVTSWIPTTNSWTELAVPPRPVQQAQWPKDVGWTGTDVIFSGDSLAYRPSTGQWREIADAPFTPTRSSSEWTGRELIVTGLISEEIPVASTAIAYDPVTDQWRLLPASGLDGQALDTEWTGDALVGVDYSSNARLFDPEADRWTGLPEIPVDFGNDWPKLAAIDGVIYLISGLGNFALDPADPVWVPLPSGPLDGTPRYSQHAIVDSAVALVSGQQLVLYVP